MKISEDFEDDPNLIHLLVAPRLMADIKATEEALGEILADAIRAKVQTPTLYSSWSYLRPLQRNLWVNSGSGKFPSV